MKDYNYDITFIGAGPSSVFAILKLIDNNYQGKICLIEKGKSLKDRKSSEIISGFCGAGTFSDSKLSSALDVGGTIPNLTQDELNKYEDYILKTLNKFKKSTQNPEALKWDITEDFDTSNTTLGWNKHKTCHIGTENGQAIYKKIEEFFETQPNIDMFFNLNVNDIIDDDNNFRVCLEGYRSFKTKKLVLATGQKNTLPSRVVKNYNLNSTPRAFQLGVRVVDQINTQYEKIIKANYDFKFTKNYDYDKVKVRVRTFCCNSGNAHVCAEKASEGFTCFNGHSFKTPNPDNNTVNYGIMCEVYGLDKFNSKENQIQLMKQINDIDTWYDDNFYNDGKTDEVFVIPKRKLLDGFPQLIGYYPDEVIKSLEDFTNELNKIVDLSKANYLYPEVKLSGLIPDLNYKTFETKKKNLYMIGDCAISRGITKACTTGIMFAENQLKEV